MLKTLVMVTLPQLTVVFVDHLILHTEDSSTLAYTYNLVNQVQILKTLSLGQMLVDITMPLSTMFKTQLIELVYMHIQILKLMIL